MNDIYVIVQSFYGNQEQVGNLLQVLSHASRTYFYHQRDTLKGHIPQRVHFYKNVSERSLKWKSWIIQARLNNKISYGSSFYDGPKTEHQGHYEGELDEYKRANGVGVLTVPGGDKHIGTWKDNMRHGYSK